MIISNRKHALDYLGINARLDTALRFIAETDLATLSDDNHLIDGEDVRVKVQHMTTKLPENAKLEAHDAFADIQMVIEGQETLMLCFRGGELVETEAHPERDIFFYEGASQSVRLSAGQFIIVFPDDVHAPGVCCGEPAEIRKAVFKVRL